MNKKVLHEGLQKHLASLEGLISVECGLFLQKLAVEITANTDIVELGSYKGKSSCYLATGAKAGYKAHVWCIDPWDLVGNKPVGKLNYTDAWIFNTWRNNVQACGVTRQISVVKDFSVNAAKKFNRPVGMIFIDGNHTYEGVKADFEAWYPHLVKDAVVVFDDYVSPHLGKLNLGVEQFVNELRETDILYGWELVPAPMIMAYVK